MKFSNDEKRLIETYYKENSEKLFLYAKNALGNPDQAKDAVQETFRIACTKHKEFLSSANPTGWLVNVLKNVIKNIRRSNARLNKMIIKIISMKESDLTILDTSDNVDLMYSDLLKREEFELLKMIVLEKATIKEVSEKIGIPQETCKKRVQRAKIKLRKIIENIESND